MTTIPHANHFPLLYEISYQQIMENCETLRLYAGLPYSFDTLLFRNYLKTVNTEEITPLVLNHCNALDGLVQSNATGLRCIMHDNRKCSWVRICKIENSELFSTLVSFTLICKLLTFPTPTRYFVRTPEKPCYLSTNRKKGFTNQYPYNTMTSSKRNIFRVNGPNSSISRKIPSQRPITRRFDVLFDLRLNKQLSK